MSKRNRERRQQRQQGRKAPAKPGPSQRDQAEVASFLRNFEDHLNTPEPASWPGACDASLARPDLVKQELAVFATGGDPGRAKCRQLERDLENGVLHSMPDLNHWAMEEFFWHGLPGDPWHPIEALLTRTPGQFSAEAGTQLRRWKEARIGFYEVGPVTEDRVILREWDPGTRQECGADFQAIALNIGGVNYYRSRQDWINLTYVSPWSPEAGLSCCMGYGVLLPPEKAAAYLPLLGLRQPQSVARPVPWRASPAAKYEYAKTWRQRAWHDWLAEKLVFPFSAIIEMPEGQLQVYEVRSLLPATPEEVRDFGIYLEADLGRGEGGATGATAAMPVDPASPNALTLAEYRAYRELAGPPRAVKGAAVLEESD
jgi:hypothetical protein